MIIVANGSSARRRASCDLLERAGYDVREVVSLDSAIDAARTGNPLAVVVEAPDSGGGVARFLNRVRRDTTTEHLPVVVLGSPPKPDFDRRYADVEWLGAAPPARMLLTEVAYLTRPHRLRPFRC